MGQPATAGAIVAAIFGCMALAFFGYRLYRWTYWRGLRRSDNVVAPGELPMSNNNLLGGNGAVTTPPAFSTPASTSNRSTMVVGSLYGETYNRRDSLKSGSMPGTPFFGPTGNEAERHRRRYSSLSGMMASTPNSEFGATAVTPDTASVTGPPRSDSGIDKETIASPSESHDASMARARGRAISSSDSTMTIKRTYATSSIRPSSTYAGSTMRGSSGNLSAMANGDRRRDSYLPHLPENREQIQIIPPQPLGFGLGGMATAIDQRTLGFSKTSGIGEFGDDFSQSLIWHVQQGDAQATSEAVQAGLMTREEAAQLRNAGQTGAGPSNLSASGTFSQDERSRYLAQGPTRSLTPTQRARIHNHIYPNSQPGSIGQRTPDVEQSPRSRSPARELWGQGANGSIAANGDAGYTSSGSDIGPSVSQRGGLAPSSAPEPASAPSDANEASSPVEVLAPAPVHDAAGSLDIAQSPLDKLRVAGLESPRSESVHSGASPLLGHQFASFGQVEAQSHGTQQAV